jgi:hypothetical protein
MPEMDAAARDEAVRRLREESARRIARARRGAVVSRCALGGVLSLALFASVEARREAPLAVATIVAPPPAPDPTVARERDRKEMCARLLSASYHLRLELGGRLARAHGKKQHTRIWAEMRAKHDPLARLEVERGCPVAPLTPEELPRIQPQGCGCGGCGHGF